ncbi:unnamed protein product [Bursaphelenchus okinawaensis]|uniref:Uncharacterized protein n=1 Tax=Bursaphelenchus okinawaensis TaxID=465554 RepID=A0A811KCU4_9BILA|nr:unnamed protein product [Bursaphelenchus okinawaensis]CAG9101137.1 unnamed protein product [Bursaphelenchus okinawaensis]
MVGKPEDENCTSDPSSLPFLDDTNKSEDVQITRTINVPETPTTDNSRKSGDDSQHRKVSAQSPNHGRAGGSLPLVRFAATRRNCWTDRRSGLLTEPERKSAQKLQINHRILRVFRFISYDICEVQMPSEDNIEADIKLQSPIRRSN